MKTLTLTAMAILFAPLAHADFNSDAAGKSVRCVGHQTIVVLDKARTEIMVIDAIDPGHPAKYKITKRESDGDSFVSYKGKEIGGTDEATVSLDDRGDEIVYKDGSKMALKCP
jgi:hypothetical protein